MTNITKKRVRGLGKKPAMLCTSIRMDKQTLDFFKKHYPTTAQVKMREVLAAYVQSQLEGAK